MLSTDNFNVETVQNVDVPQNFAMRFVSLKNDDSGSLLRHQNSSMKKMTNIANLSFPKQIKNPNVMKKPRENDQEILDFFLYQFKCQPCQLKKGTCQDKSTCEGWHHEGERRRNPGIAPNFLYSEEPCPKLKAPGTSKWSKPTNCKNGDSCRFSHTLMEQMYHPNIYKTSLCTNFTANGGDQCQWGYFCTHAHGQKDIRNLNKKDLFKRQLVNDKQKTRNNLSQISNGRPLEAFRQAVSVIPKLFHKISPIDTPCSDNDNLTYLDQQVTESQYNSDNGSPSHSYQTPLYQSSMGPTAINTPSTKYSMTPSGSVMTQSSKLPQLLLPSASYYQSQMSLSSVTPNTMTGETTYYNAFHTHSNHLENDKQYSWDVNSSDISNLQQSPSTYTPINNMSRSPPPISTTPFDIYNTNNNHIHIVNNTSNISNGSNGMINLSPGQGAQLYISPQRLPTTHSVNVLLPNLKLQGTSTNSAGLNQLTPTYTIGQIPSYLTSTSTYQTGTLQLQAQTTNVSPCDDINVNASMSPPVSQNCFNNTFSSKTFHPISDTMTSIQEVISPQCIPEISEISQINLTNVKNLNVDNNSLAKESINNVSYYFLGDDSLLSPLSNRPDGLTKTPPPPRASSDVIVNKDTENAIVIQLKAEINELKKELESEKEKNKTHQNSESHDNENSMIDKTQEQANLFEKCITCPSCHSQKGVMRDYVLVQCGHLVCKECVPQKSEHCLICLRTANTCPQKLNV